MAALQVQGNRKHATETNTSRGALSSSPESSLTWCLSQLSKPGLVAEDQRKGATGPDTAGVREVDKRTRAGQWRALVAIRTQHIKAGSSGIAQFRAKGGLPPLLNLIKEPECSRKTLDLALSILANCCTERETRVEVRKLGGISVVVDILKRNVATETVQNRAARALGNLAMDPESSALIHSAGGVPLLLLCVSLSSAPSSPLVSPSKAPCPKMECAQSAARALLYLSDTPANRLLLLTQGTLTALAPLIAPEYPLGLRRSALRTLHELTRGCAVECAREVSRSGLLAQLGVMSSGEECDKPFEEHSLKTLANLCSQGCLRPLVGSLGVIPKFTEEVKKDPLKSGVFLKALCLCCKEAVNRAKVKESGGLEVLIGFLSAHRSHPLSRLAILACVDFVYDEAALEQLQELGLVPLLVARLVELAKGEELSAGKMDVSLASTMSASELLSSSCFDSFDFPHPEGNRKEEVGKEQGLGSSSFLSLRSWLVSEGLISSEGDLLDTPGGVEGDWGSLQIPSSSPLTLTPDGHSPSKCSSPSQSLPSSTPKPGPLVQPAFCNPVSPLSQLHLPSPCKDAGLSASTPHSSSASTPLLSSASTPLLSSASTPHSSSASTPLPSSASTPHPSSASTPLPSSASTPLPSSASTPHPSTPHSSSASTPLPPSASTPHSASNSHPSSASTPLPSSASTPHPSSASTPHPSSSSTPQPSSASLSSPSKAPLTPLSPSKFSSPPRKRPRVHSAVRSILVALDAPPSVSRPLVFQHPYHPEPWAPESPILLLLSRFSHATDPGPALVNSGIMSGLLFYLTQHQDPTGRCFRILCRLSCNPNCLQALVRTGSVALIRHHLCQREGGQDRADRQTDRVKAKVKQLGLALLGNLRIQCESGFGSGVLSHVMLSGSESDKLNCALSLPLINSNKVLLKKLLLDSGGLLLALEPLGCPEDDDGDEEEEGRHAGERRRFLSDWLNSPQRVSAPQLRSLYFSLLSGCLSGLISCPKAELNKKRPGTPAPNKTPPASEAARSSSPPPVKKPRLDNLCRYGDSAFDLLFLLDDGTRVSANREAVAGAEDAVVVGSEYFRALLRGGFGEAQSGTADAIPIRDVSRGMLLPVLHYLHGCRLGSGLDDTEEQEGETGRGHCHVLGSLASEGLGVWGEGAEETQGFPKTPLAEMMIGACRFLVAELQREVEDLCVSLLLSCSARPAGRTAPALSEDAGKKHASSVDQCGSGGESADESLANRTSGLELSGSEAQAEMQTSRAGQTEKRHGPGFRAPPGKTEDKRQPASGSRPKIKSLPNTTSDVEMISSGVSPIPKPSVSKMSKTSQPKGSRLTSKSSMGSSGNVSDSSSVQGGRALGAVLPQVYWFSQRYSYPRLGRACLSVLLGSPQTFSSSSSAQTFSSSSSAQTFSSSASAGDCLRRLAREADCTEALKRDLVHLTTMALC